jgi:hypothetical protein
VATSKRPTGRGSFGGLVSGHHLDRDEKARRRSPAAPVEVVEVLALGRRAVAGALRVDPFAKREKESAELSALCVREPGEQFVFDFTLRLGGAIELLSSGICEADYMPSAIGGVAVSGEVARGFERVEQPYDDARVGVQERAELALTDGPPVMQQSEHMELPWRKVVLDVGRSQSLHRVLTQERQE